MNTLLGKHWHHLPSDELIDLLDTDLQQGLDVFETNHRQECFGINLLTSQKGKSQRLRFLPSMKIRACEQPSGGFLSAGLPTAPKSACGITRCSR